MISKEDFKYLSQEFGNNLLDLVKQKGFFSFEYMSEFKKFKEQLPSKEKFCNTLAAKKIGGKEYKDALNAWSKFGIKTMKNYRDLCLKCDTLLLTDVFEKLRNNSIKNYGSSPSHYLNAPILSWDAILHMKKWNLNLFQILTWAFMYL